MISEKLFQKNFWYTKKHWRQKVWSQKLNLFSLLTSFKVKQLINEVLEKNILNGIHHILTNQFPPMKHENMRLELKISCIC
jgi:hypothetical protein